MKIRSHFTCGGEDRFSPSQQPSVYPIADGIRGLACLMVLVAHAVTMFYPKTAPYLAGSEKNWSLAVLCSECIFVDG